VIQNLLFIGHRGTRIDFDENTIIAFEMAILAGANYIEFDVRKSKDEKLIVIHDSALERTTNGEGLLKNYNYKEIKQFKTRLNNYHIPLLSDVLGRFAGKTKFIIELKEVGIGEKIIELVYKKNLMKDCIFSGRILSELINIKNLVPESLICYNITKGKGLKLKEFFNLAVKRELPLNFDMVNLNSHLINPQFIEICRKNNILALAWDFIEYLNPLERIKRFVEMGIDGILFDNYQNIEIAKRWLNND